MQLAPVFTDDVSIHFRTAGERHLPPAGASGLRMLEVGVHEARSACWFLNRYPDSRYLGIDPWRKPETFERARKNLSLYADRAEMTRGTSLEVLPTLAHLAESFDVIHVDGLHTIEMALLDGLLAWPLLAYGGWMAFDDLLHGEKVCVQPAFDAFVRVQGNGCQMLERGRQGWVRKL